MTRDDIIRMAREAFGAPMRGAMWGMNYSVYMPDLERFAALVAAAEREAIIDIVAMHGGSVEIEAAIRARSANV